jgi:phosphoadenosine phosphosulfate reductase
MSLQQKIEDARGLILEQLELAQPACVTSSFQTECMVLVHLLHRERPAIPVLFLDTGYHFPETIAYRDRMAAAWDLNLVNLRPAESVPEQESRLGILYQSAPDRCCGLRKVEPLFAALEPYTIWFTALRREQSPTRANLQPADNFRLPSGKELRKISPLALWTNQDIWGYLKMYEIPVLPLYDEGYTSIGCQPCTTRPISPDDLRSGRWGGHKLECGIHLGSQ